MGNIQGITNAEDCICPVTTDVMWTGFEITSVPTEAFWWPADRQTVYQQSKDTSRTFLFSSKAASESIQDIKKSRKFDTAFQKTTKLKICGY